MKTVCINITCPLSFSTGWLLLFFHFLSAQAQVQPRISSIQFFGNTFYSQRQLAESIPLKNNTPFTQTALHNSQAALVDLYRAEGFYFFRFDSVVTNISDDSSSAQIEMYLHEGERTLVSEIVFSGNMSIGESFLRPLIETSADMPLNAPLLESDIRSILTYYANHGFPFTTVRSDSIRIDMADNTKLIVQLNIDEGPKVYLDEIQTEGNTTTSAGVIAREVRLQKGEMFQQEKLDRIRRRLERLQIFSSVAEPQLYVTAHDKPDSMRGGLLISVKEGSTNTFDGILGYVPSAVPNTDGYFTGNVFVAMRNLFGTGRKAMVKWIRETATTQELELQYREPWLFNVPLSVGASFYQRKQDSSYVKTKIDLRGEFAVTEELIVAGNISAENVYPSADLLQFSVFESNALFFGGEILYDTRDNLRNPTSGVRYSTTVQQGTKSITGPQKLLDGTVIRSFSVQKLSLDVEIFISTFSSQVLFIGLHGKKISSSQLELSDLFQFGGTTTLRGYRENQFFASQLAYINGEYRFLTGRASSLYGFVDAGYFSRPADMRKRIVGQERSVYGYGIGARVETGLGILNLSYALGEGDSFSNGKIHVGIINEF